MPADTYFKVLGLNGEAINGGTGTWNLPTRKGRPGKWMERIPNPVLCERGYHVVQGEMNLIPFLGPKIWVVEIDGAQKGDGQKLVVERARIIAPTAWDSEVAVKFAIECASHVLEIFEKRYPNDDRPRKAIEAAVAARAASYASYASAAASAAASATASDAASASYAASAASYAASAASYGASAASYAASHASYGASYAASHAASAASHAASYAASHAAAAASEQQFQADVLASLLFPTKG